MRNPYKEPMRIDIYAPAEMCETAAGWNNEDAERELVFALGAAHISDRASLRWLAVAIERFLGDDPSDPPNFD